MFVAWKRPICCQLFTIVSSKTAPGGDHKSAEKRQIIAESGSIPAFTLTLPRDQANKLLTHGWPASKHIPAAGREMVPMMVISDGRCMCLFVRRV